VLVTQRATTNPLETSTLPWTLQEVVHSFDQDKIKDLILIATGLLVLDFFRNKIMRYHVKKEAAMCKHSIKFLWIV
jgi:hypothetical protein